MKNLLSMLFTAASIVMMAKASDCYWDSDCSANSISCCVGGFCQSETACNILRNYPLPNFQACYSSNDCSSGCCNNNFCTWNETCNATSAAVPLVIFLVLTVIVTSILIGFLIKEIFLNRKRQQLDTFDKSQSNALLVNQRYFTSESSDQVPDLSVYKR